MEVCNNALHVFICHETQTKTPRMEGFDPHALFRHRLAEAREQLAPHTIHGVLDTYKAVPVSKVREDQCMYLLHTNYNDDAAAAHIAKHFWEFSSLADFKMKQTRSLAEGARIAIRHHASLVAAYESMLPILDALAVDATQLFSM
jgi:hypothetical protein